MSVLRALLAAAALAAILLPAGTARGDRETAEFFAKRAETALREKNPAQAEEQARRALEEDATFLPARMSLAEALAAEGKTPEAVAEFRATAEAADKLKPPPAGWADLAARARKRLGEVGATGDSVERIVRRYADDLVALADRWKAKDRALAERALRRALEVLPDHAPASERLAAMGKEGAKAVVVVFDGKSFDDFVPSAKDEVWAISDGVLKGGLAGKSKVLQSGRIFTGDFDVRMEARIAKKLGDTPKIAVVAAAGVDKTGLVFGVLEDSVVLEHEVGGGGPADRRMLWSSLLRNLKPTFDPSQWTAYEIRLRGDEVSVLVNGNLLHRERRPKERDKGAVGVNVQDVKGEVRKFEVLPR